MIWRGRSTYRPRPSRTIPPPELIGPMLEPNNVPQQEEPLAESQNPTPGQEREEDQGAAEIQVPDLEADLRELPQSKTGDECGDGTDDQGNTLPESEQLKMPEGDGRQPQS
ncbi:X antigen family member 3 [Saimiri boliviensis]|uniref:X antigen family member 3 n=1 Tax=Saimiri boliviensis boliviensis TaxID=39432 RepID=A0A2K6UBL4_SAIBB|nr:X antigen family member 3 [Saimiri boliviensis boliviensis]XP_010329887.1 X antigen family member 3 [Saimiri boliviensis boliviensis]